MSKLLSRILRHDPSAVGITLDPAGWVEVEALLSALGVHAHRLSRSELADLVAASDKQRFALDPATDRIRANQGHSIAVDLGLAPVTPPARLYHGTPSRNVESILAHGINRGARHDVHLSPDVETARRVGARRGRALCWWSGPAPCIGTATCQRLGQRRVAHPAGAGPLPVRTGPRRALGSG